MMRVFKYTTMLSFLFCISLVCKLYGQKSNPFLEHSRSLLKEGDRFVMQHNYDSARHYLNLAQRECYAELHKLNQDTSSLVLLYKIQTTLGELYMLESEFRLAERSFQEALESAKKFGGRKEMGLSLHNLGATYSQIGDIDLAYQNYQKAIFFEKNSGDSLALASTLNNIGETFYLQYEFNTAIIFLLEALQIHNSVGDLKSNSSTFNSITLAYLKLNKLDSAFMYMQKAKENSILFNDSLNLARMYRNQGELLIRQKQFSSSINPLSKCLNINIKLQNKIEIAMCYKLMSEAYMEVGMLDEAEKYAFKSLDLGIRYNLVEVRVEVLRVLSESFLLKKDYSNAYLLKKEYKAAKDSFINKANNARLYELKMIYQANSKDQALVQKKSELELQQISSKRFQVELLFYTVLLIGLVALFLFLYFGYQNRLKSEQRLRNKQRLNQEQKSMILEQMSLLDQHTKRIRLHNERIKQQNDKLETKKEIINKQTTILETQQSEIIASLFYAQKIQKAVFSSFSGQLNNDIDDFFAFVSGDIISSSFVWKEQFHNRYVYIIIDSLSPGILSSLSTLMIFTQMKSWISKVKRMKAEDINKFFAHKINEFIEDEFGVNLYISILLFNPKQAHVEFFGQHSLWIVDEEEQTKREFSEQKQTVIKQTETVYMFSNSYSNLLDIDNIGLLFEKMHNQTSHQKKETFEASVPESPSRASSDFFMLGLKVANYH